MTMNRMKTFLLAPMLALLAIVAPTIERRAP